MTVLSHLWTARGLVIFGFLSAAVPVGATFVHVGDEAARMFDGSTDSWYHFFREGFGDLGAIVAILVILFAAPRFRSPTMWWVMRWPLLQGASWPGGVSQPPDQDWNNPRHCVRKLCMPSTFSGRHCSKFNQSA
jgi:hypothetical protein